MFTLRSLANTRRCLRPQRPAFRFSSPSLTQPTPQRSTHLISLIRRSYASPPAFRFQSLFEKRGEEEIEYRKISSDGVKVIDILGKKGISVTPEAITNLSTQAFIDVGHLLRPKHLEQLSSILKIYIVLCKDPEASENDRFVALELLKNANIASGMVLPSCQDTGTAIVMGKRGQYVMTEGTDEEDLSRGVYESYTKKNLRYSQVAPLSMFEEKNTGSNLPAQIDLYATKGNEYHFQFIAKGGGSANKTFLYQQTKALLNPESLMKFVEEKIKTLGIYFILRNHTPDVCTSACPPYHLAIVIGGLSAEMNLKTVKMASTKYYDDLHTSGNEDGRYNTFRLLIGSAFRDTEWEEKIHQITRDMGIGAQFGGKYFCHDVRVIRLPRHGASCPVGIGVSCSADRQILGKITEEGVFLEKLETDPSKYLPDVTNEDLGSEVKKINLNQPMKSLLSELSAFPVTTRLSLTGTLVVARDIAHAKLKERIDSGEIYYQGLPDYMKNHPVYYAGPAKTPEGYASGSFGPTTAGRMDSYVSLFQLAPMGECDLMQKEHGGSMVMLAKGNRSSAVTRACKKFGGFYLGSIGGPAAILAKNCIKSVEVLEYPELGMEAVWKIEVEDFPAFVVVDDKGNDFFKKWSV